MLVAAIGRAGLVRAEHVKPGAVVVDVGMNRVHGRGGGRASSAAPTAREEFARKGYLLVGDVHAPSVRELASARSRRCRGAWVR